MHSGFSRIPVRIQGFVSDQSQYAYGDFKAPRTHTGTVIITVYIRGLIPLESPYAYCDWTNPDMCTGIHLGPHMHTGIDTTQIPVLILRVDKSRYAYGDSSRSPYAYGD